MKDIKILDNWFVSNILGQSISDNFKRLLLNLDLNDILWIKLIDKNLSIKSFSENLSSEITLKDKLERYNSIKLGSEMIINDNLYRIINKFDFGNSEHIILYSGKSNISDGIISILSIAIKTLDNIDKINFLDFSTKLVYSNPNEIGLQELKHDSKISNSFINSVVPVVTYSVVNEDFGPNFIATWPSSFNVIKNMLFVVNVYSTLNSEQIARHGQVLNSTPTNLPEDGEATSIVFTIPNDIARGTFEIHGITIVISQNFINISKALIIQIKSLIFSAVEQIRQLTFFNNWCLIKGEIDLDPIISLIEPLLKGLQIQIASLFAIQIGMEEVSKWI